MGQRLLVSPRGGDRQLDGSTVATLRLQEAIDKATAGTTISLLPGVYDEPGVFDAKSGSKTHPIVLEGNGGVTLDGRRMPFRPPDDHPVFEHPAFLKFRGSQWIVIRDLAIQNGWSTAIFVEDSRHLDIERVAFHGGTFAIFCRGRKTRDVSIRHCAWSQDPAIWHGILWRDIHVPPRPRKELDGDFLRAVDVHGRFRITNNLISNAFNGIHFFAGETCPLGDANNDIVIANNTFSHIRDNAVESEFQATNWWVYGNRIHNCHSWFAFENSKGGHWYVFGNTGWFDSKPGPPHDEFHGGGVLKTTKKAKWLNEGPFYVFHNSWYLRSAYLKKGLLDNFHHVNNAVVYCDPARHPPGVGDFSRRMFAPNSAEVAGSGMFEFPLSLQEAWRDGVKDGRDRRALSIKFLNDACNHSDLHHLEASPGFDVRQIHPLGDALVDPRGGDFDLKGDALKGRSTTYELLLPRNGPWHLPNGLNIGAVGEAKTKDNPFGVYRPATLGCPPDAIPSIEVART